MQTKAIEVIKNNVPGSGDEVEDLGYVSDALVRALRLIAGDFLPVDVKATIDTSEADDEEHSAGCRANRRGRGVALLTLSGRRDYAGDALSARSGRKPMLAHFEI
jgi:hypothetical protein